MEQRVYSGEERRQYSHIEQQLDRIIGQIDHLQGAFPVVNGRIDVDGHRAYHDAKIKAALKEAEFWTDIRQEAIRKGIWFTIVLVTGLILIGIQTKVAIWVAGIGR